MASWRIKTLYMVGHTCRCSFLDSCIVLAVPAFDPIKNAWRNSMMLPIEKGILVAEIIHQSLDLVTLSAKGSYFVDPFKALLNMLMPITVKRSGRNILRCQSLAEVYICCHYDTLRNIYSLEWRLYFLHAWARLRRQTCAHEGWSWYLSKPLDCAS